MAMLRNTNPNFPKNSRCQILLGFSHRISCVLLLILAGLVQPNSALAQCMMIPISLEDQASKSDLIAEGVVKEKDAFVTAAGNFIYTTYQIEITKIFKGQPLKSIVQLVEVGGVVGHRHIEVSPSISLKVGESGTFFLEVFTFNDPQDGQRYAEPVYRAYASSQSVFSYDFDSQTVNSHFNQFELDSWYEDVTKVTGLNYKKVNELSYPEKLRSSMVPTISSMSPLTITAGTFSVLTINGNGFGASQGGSIVEFKNANNGGTTWLNTSSAHTMSWTDTQIQIKVPYAAGSGQVRVTVSAMSVISSQSLAIPYNQFNFEYDVPPVSLFKVQLRNINGLGGYTFRYHTEFNSNVPARKSFERALNSWRCAMEVNFIIGDVTSLDVCTQDQTNVVRFDNGTELPAGVGARTYNYYDDCLSLDPYTMDIVEIDLVFNDVFEGVTWEYGPDFPSGTEIDFESIALHELGHANVLGHVISTPEVLHFNIGPGQHKRILSANDIAGGSYVHAQSTSNPPNCGDNVMTDYRQVKYVNINTTGIQSGDTWAQAYKYLQDALAAVSSCVDTIYIAAGTYYPDEGTGLGDGDQSLRFTLNTPIVLMGGYSATTGVRNLATTQTYLSGDIDKNNSADAPNSMNVVRMTAAAHLDGLYVENGHADALAGEGLQGAGIYMSAGGTIRNCVLRWNVAIGLPPNSVGRGGGLLQTGGTSTLHNVLLYNNFALVGGSAIQIDNGVMQCKNGTIASNSPNTTAVRIENSAQVFQNSIFYNNSTDMQIGSGSADVSNSLFQAVALPGGATGSNVLLNTNPLFVNLGGFNFSLIPCSPAVNTGNNAYNPTTTDVLGNSRLVSTIDRGAFENTTGLPPTVVTSTGNSGAGTLRTIITDCCSGNTITFAAGLTGQTIGLTSTIVIDKPLNIHGLGINNLNIGGNGSHRIFSVNTGITSTIKDLAMINGDSGASMGNVILNAGNLTLHNARLTSEPNTTTKVTLSNTAGYCFPILRERARSPCIGQVILQ